MGITHDKMYKKSKTGAVQGKWHKKRKYNLGRQPANTKLIVKVTSKKNEGQKISTIRCRGGNIKRRALRLSHGSFAWGSADISHKARIIQVVYNSTSNELVRTNTLVKGCVVQIDSTPFKDALSNDELDKNILDQIRGDCILARISSRPGQVGTADGYILEGPELLFYQKKLAPK